MTKGELIKALEHYDDDAVIYIKDCGSEMYIEELKKDDIEEYGNDIYINT